MNVDDPESETEEPRGAAPRAKSNSGGAGVLPQATVAREFINGKPSDVEGLKQVVFHAACATAAGLVVARALREIDASAAEGGGVVGGLLLLCLGELLLALCSSFYFTGFHECIHGTAFASQPIASALSHALGFATLRGANWYYYFHWHHHRFTNDPARDPELSGSTTDRTDPHAAELSAAARARAYLLFLSGYPFGFERLGGMARHALGAPPAESWVDTSEKRRVVRLEYRLYLLAYVTLGAMSLARPAAVGRPLWYYWLLPHMLGSGHLRYFQTAEHRGCPMGPYAGTSAWLVSRTTATYRLYCRLAWNMPYHQEHHAWPNVPFYLLPELHARVVAGGRRPRLACEPSGEFGYLWIHRVLWRQVLSGKKDQ